MFIVSMMCFWRGSQLLVNLIAFQNTSHWRGDLWNCLWLLAALYFTPPPRIAQRSTVLHPSLTCNSWILRDSIGFFGILHDGSPRCVIFCQFFKKAFRRHSWMDVLHPVYCWHVLAHLKYIWNWFIAVCSPCPSCFLPRCPESPTEQSVPWPSRWVL